MNSYQSASKWTALLLAALLSSGCASLGRTVKNWLNGKDSSDGPILTSVSTPRYSDQDNVRPLGSGDRQYKRMNRQRLEDEADLAQGAGSLWVMEGQGAYLFSQNQIRMVGDLLNVRIEGSSKSQLQTKVRVIGRLLERLDNPRAVASVGAGVQAGSQANTQQPGQAGQQGANQQNANQNKPEGGGDAGQTGQAATVEVQGKPEIPFSVQAVPTRIVEQLKDGSYRVRGMQPFMIGKREYKVIVTGVVRPEDFDDAGIDATKLLDPQFDIVSSRKGASL